MVVINDVIDGIETNLQAITGLRTYSEWPDVLNAPAAIVFPSEEFITPITLEGGYSMSYEVLVLVEIPAGVVRGQRALNPYCDTSGNTSIRVAVEADSTLGGTVSDIIYMGAFDYARSYKFGTVTYLGVTHRFALLV